MSTLGTIIAAVVTKETAAARTIGANALTVVKRKLPKREEPVDAAYQVNVTGAEVPDSVTRIAFGSTFKVEYRIEITLIAPNDHDAATTRDEHGDWREAVRADYMKPAPLMAVSAVKRVEIVPGALFDRSKLNEGYDYNQITLAVWTYETRAS